MVIVSRRRCVYKQLFCVDFGLVLIKNIALGFLTRGSMKILVAEDDVPSAQLLKAFLKRSRYDVEIAANGREALELLKRGKYDALLTDWMMPEMDGVELIRHTRSEINPCPLIIMITAIDSKEARMHALQAGADDFLAKPYGREQLLKSLENGLARMAQAEPQPVRVAPAVPAVSLPPLVGVVVAVSTGGPPALIKLFKAIPATCEAAFFVVQHGPAWMLETFSPALERETGFKFCLGAEGTVPVRGRAYLSPGDRHLVIHAGSGRLGLSEDPPENFVRPAADPLFRSASSFFGRYCIGLVLTGMGRDGAKGASHVKAGGGLVFVQDPATAVVCSMPKTVIAAGAADKVLSLPEMSETIVAEAHRLSTELDLKLRNRS